MAAAASRSVCTPSSPRYGQRSLILSVWQKRTWNRGMGKWWGSGVTHSAHALKPPTRTHLWQIMGHVVTVYIPSCHSCGLKSPANTYEICSFWVFFYCLTGNSVHWKRHFLFPSPGLEDCLLAAALSIWQREGDVFTHTRCSFTLEYIHPGTLVWLCVHRCLCLPEEN